tara:strand:+ start:287 stop:565 length:279 start_codon:yes stop_codon:yes gene_type:complete
MSDDGFRVLVAARCRVLAERAQKNVHQILNSSADPRDKMTRVSTHVGYIAGLKDICEETGDRESISAVDVCLRNAQKGLKALETVTVLWTTN